MEPVSWPRRRRFSEDIDRIETKTAHFFLGWFILIAFLETSGVEIARGIRVCLYCRSRVIWNR
jgi:hypothetical protein